MSGCDGFNLLWIVESYILIRLLKRVPWDSCGLMEGQFSGWSPHTICVGHLVVAVGLPLRQYHSHSPSRLVMFVQYGATVYDHICFNGLLWGLQAQFHLEDLMLSEGNRIFFFFFWETEFVCLFIYLFLKTQIPKLLFIPGLAFGLN